MTETALDLRYNIAALTIAICSEKYTLPEKAFSIISEEKFKLNDNDTEDMISLREQGTTFRAIGEIYGVSDSDILKRIKRYKAKKEKELSDGHLKSSRY
ncbi:hypothetical protein [Tissierella sp.]|uniref:hypothetical protein n=1 Tax=Tissierella sp. TaxID=41274 RepID=UPI00285AD8FD|nr:hypothetical protein [Tissierella sp.]MDR7856333.1 hypothetical protein [Tissierella sp.]